MANHILFSLMEHPNQYWRPLQLSILRMRERCCLQVLISTQFLTRMSCQHHPTRNFLPKSIWTEISPLDNNNHRETVLVQPFFSFQKDACYTMFGLLLELLCQLVGFPLIFFLSELTSKLISELINFLNLRLAISWNPPIHMAMLKQQ